MADGSAKPIEKVKVGDKVMATDPETGKTQAKDVTATIIGTGEKKLVEVIVVNATGTTGTVTATDGHPFWVPARHAWVDATDLAPGVRLRTPTGTTVKVLAVHRYGRYQRVHNLSVEGFHTYYVTAGSVSDLLVHNSGCGPDADPPDKPEIDGDSIRRQIDPKAVPPEKWVPGTVKDVSQQPDMKIEEPLWSRIWRWFHWPTG